MVTSTVIVSDQLMVKTSWWEQTTQSRKDVKSLGTPCVQETPLPRKNVKYFMYHFKKCLQKLFNLNDLSTTRGAQLQLWNDRWHIWMNISVEEIKANTCTKMCAMSLSLQKSQKQPSRAALLLIEQFYNMSKKSIYNQ